MIEEKNDLKIVLDFILKFGAEGLLPCPDEGGSGDVAFEAAVRLTTKKTEEKLFKDALHWVENAAAWDIRLWEELVDKEGYPAFNGDAKELNRTFARGLRLALNEPAFFKIWHYGFIDGCGMSINTLAEKLKISLEEELA